MKHLSVFFLITTLLNTSCKKEEPVEEVKKGAAEVLTADIAMQDLSQFVEGYGTVVAANSAVLNVSLPRAIVITRLLVMPGQSIVKGQALFEGMTDPMGRLSFRQAEVAAKAAAEELSRLQNLFAKQLATSSQLAAAKKAQSDAKEVLKSELAIGNGSGSIIYQSPFDANVSTIAATQGDHLQASAPILQLSGGTAAQVLIGIEPDDATSVKAGMEVLIKANNNSKNLATGSVKTVSRAINPATQLVDVWVDLPANPFLIGSKIFGNVRILTVHTLAVPRTAILNEGKGSRIFIVADNKAVSVAVKKGVETEDFVAVEAPVKVGDKVVTLGNAVLEDGMPIVESAQ
ncbi:MAG: efflux RND transporter periplasmic adaptor subunit [Oligoflexus sp.]|nr:efflux RND transporter periplasmic adaptor subunit [Oligoflexus sp.]